MLSVIGMKDACKGHSFQGSRHIATDSILIWRRREEKMDFFDFVVATLAFSAGFLFGAFWVSAKRADVREYAWQDALMRVPIRADAESFVRAANGSDANGVQTPIWAPGSRRPVT
jgi:hypothetical protein